MVILAKLAVILKLGSRNISKRITNLMFIDSYTTATCFDSCISFCFKRLTKLTLNSTEKAKKPNLNPQQNNLPLAISLWLLSLLVLSFFFVCLFDLFLFLFFCYSDTNYCQILLSYLHFVITYYDSCKYH